MKRRKYPHSPLSLSLSHYVHSFSLLSPFLPFNTFPPLLSHETYLSDDLFSSQSDSLSIYMKRRKYPPSLSLSLSLSLSFIQPAFLFLLPLPYCFIKSICLSFFVLPSLPRAVQVIFVGYSSDIYLSIYLSISVLFISIYLSIYLYLIHIERKTIFLYS
ncbi:unnamed protein product [Acanthosepion pharaonis]|uniref:Uncharacterized protein n=1 Tax=Acanthosepion pharaonis TaxID=158019 RepID=A0A812CE63_ACAPH|nr:unnamed protein product [Sepia pharaonis]